MHRTENGKRLEKWTYSCEKHNYNRFIVVAVYVCVFGIDTTISVGDDALRVVTTDDK